MNAAVLEKYVWVGPLREAIFFELLGPLPT
jgi:hypothetical protein